mgnify:CR=1 FL=1
MRPVPPAGGAQGSAARGLLYHLLFEKGLDKILKKVGEECTEVIIAAKAQDHRETVYEIADLAYHVMVLMAEKGVTWRILPGNFPSADKERGGTLSWISMFS